MNANFSAWSKDDASSEEQIDPSFARHQDDFTSVTVDDVTAAAVANANGSSSKQEGDTKEEVEAARLAAEIQRQHEEQSSQEKGVGGPIRTNHGHVSTSPLDDTNRRVRPVSNTKRAAQNRNAQKAFRQRKEKYIKDLEATAAEVTQLKQTIEELRAENLQLRDYTLVLQSRVIELSPSNHAGGNNAELAGVPTPPVVFNNKVFEK